MDQHRAPNVQTHKMQIFLHPWQNRQQRSRSQILPNQNNVGRRPHKTKTRRPFRLDRSHLMNISIDYEDEVESTNTHPLLLPKDKRPTLNPKRMSNRLHTTPIIHPRSVLGTTSLGHRIPALETHLTRVTLSVTPILEPRGKTPLKSLSLADRARAPATTK